MKDKVVMFAGYFDPLHFGHIEGLKLARKLGDKLLVVVNTDKNAIKKKGFVFMPEKERMEIIRAIKYVDEVVLGIDKDGTCCKIIELIRPDIFAKGGDRKANEIPENTICKKLGIKMVDGLGEKIQSSSNLVKKAEKIKS
jgi:rfaE bifunctional protein nucleotidyltransferase chain/domain